MVRGIFKNLSLLVLVLLISSVALPVCFAKTEVKGQKQEVVQPTKDEIEKTGNLEVRAKELPEQAKGKGKGKREQLNEFILKCDGVEYKLICRLGKGKNKDLVNKLLSLNGKTITVKGNLLPANPPKHPLAAIVVREVFEVQAQQQITPPQSSSTQP